MLLLIAAMASVARAVVIHCDPSANTQRCPGGLACPPSGLCPVPGPPQPMPTPAPTPLEPSHSPSPPAAGAHPTPGCAAAMAGACDSQRTQGESQCAQCTGAHLQALHKHGCTQPNLVAFCTNRTCGTMLDSSCAAVRDDCVACNKCVSAHTGPGTGCPNRSQGSGAFFCSDACAQDRCDDTLERLCESGRAHGAFPCQQCVGQHKPNLANCSTAQINSFCSNSSCAARLAQRCASSGASCASCANCTHTAGSTSGCSLAQQVGFCQAIVPPSAPQPPSCDMVLAQRCDAERKSGTFQCAQCTGADKNRAAAKAANCSLPDLEAFCSNTTCYALLAGGSCDQSQGSAKCAACAVLVLGKSSSAQMCKATDIDSFCAPRTPTDAAEKAALLATVKGGGSGWPVCVCVPSRTPASRSLFLCVSCVSGLTRSRR
jgi:hypothetical protein